MKFLDGRARRDPKSQEPRHGGGFNGRCPKGYPPDLLRVSRRKLSALHFAAVLSDLRAPPGNNLEALARDRKGQHSIRINDQFRICFLWAEAGPEYVEFADSH